MLAELGLNAVRFGYGGHLLLDGVDLQIEKGERIGLLGRNGQGKSTLLKVIQGVLELDGGDISRRQGLVVAGLQQEVPKDFEGTVLDQLESVLSKADLEGGWEAQMRIDQAVSELGLERGALAQSLSAGMKRRVLLARALVMDPDLLMLDEPTNHLDIEAILRLEERLLKRSGSLVFVTHDRAFLRRVATRILDLDRGTLRSYDCDYATYLVRKQAVLEAEAKEHAAFDKKLAKEEAWIRRGIRARRTRNMGRVRALEALRIEHGQRRETVGQVKAELQAADRTGRVVVRAKRISFSYGDKSVIRDFSTEIQIGDRVGLIGPNGVGKTTLLSLLFGDLEPDSGEVEHGTRLEVARFDQLHSVLDDNKSVMENVCADGDMITVGDRQRHVLGYLQDFLFSPEQARGPLWALSGGERNRVQLARILARPCNVLILDEPTNDLDVETLELLEDMLVDYPGTILLVSHDREFVDNVVTSNLVFDVDGRITEYVGGDASWQDQARARAKPVKEDSRTQPQDEARARAPRPERARRLTYKEQKELDALPALIENLESENSKLHALMAQADFFKRPGPEIVEATTRLASLEQELREAYDRWEMLESIATG